jgi:hypothetical protein
MKKRSLVVIQAKRKKLKSLILAQIERWRYA